MNSEAKRPWMGRTAEPTDAIVRSLCPAGTGWLFGVSHSVGGSRTFKMWIPKTLKTTLACPLVVLLHGCGQDAECIAEISGMNDVADVGQFIVVYPEQSRLASPLRCWNWFHSRHQNRDAGEPSILAETVRQVCHDHNVDADRIYIAGFSAGGMMGAILGATYPDLFAGIAVFAGTEFKAAENVLEGFFARKRGGPAPIEQGQLAFAAMRPGLARKNRRRMPVIVFHGTADKCVNVINAEQSIEQWSKTNACLAAANSEDGFALTEKVVRGKVPNGYSYRQHIYLRENCQLLMEKWLIEGLGHAWSGSSNSSEFGDPKGPNASEEIWRFFRETDYRPPKTSEDREPCNR